MDGEPICNSAAKIDRCVECDPISERDGNPARAINCTGLVGTKKTEPSAIKPSGDHRRNRPPSLSPQDDFQPPSAAPAAIRDLLDHSLSGASKRAYKSDLQDFEAWGGTIPATPVIVASYLATLAATHKPATIRRRLSSLAKAHRAKGFVDPTKDEIVKSVLRGIRRSVGTAQHQAKPLLKEDLFAVLECMDDRPKDLRDKALLLVGFAGAFRRSELVGLNVEDIDHVRQGIVVTLRRSKTDQEGSGRKIGIPFGRTRWCPVRHLDEWLDHAKIETGPIFRRVTRHGHIAPERLSSEAVSSVVKQRAKAAGFDPDAYSGHSLRAGLATSAVIAGVSTLSIRRTTGHASDAMLSRYVRVGDMFTDNAASAVL